MALTKDDKDYISREIGQQLATQKKDILVRMDSQKKDILVRMDSQKKDILRHVENQKEEILGEMDTKLQNLKSDFFEKIDPILKEVVTAREERPLMENRLEALERIHPEVKRSLAS